MSREATVQPLCTASTSTTHEIAKTTPSLGPDLGVEEVTTGGRMYARDSRDLGSSR
jgi:hypothetical protein